MDVVCSWSFLGILASANGMGSSLIDIGQPMANGTSVVDNGTLGKPALLNGYSIVEASNMKTAKQLADDHPFLSEGKGDFAIDIYELLPVPM